MTRARYLSALVVAAALAVAATGCSSDDTEASPDTSAPAETTTTAPKPPAEIRVFVAPGTAEGFEGARKDVTAENCTRSDTGWLTDGTLVNPTDTVVSYRVYTSFNDPSGELRALVQTDVNDVAPGAEGSWLNQVEVTDDNLTCVLRVERTPA